MHLEDAYFFPAVGPVRTTSAHPVRGFWWEARISLLFSPQPRNPLPLAPIHIQCVRMNPHRHKCGPHLTVKLRSGAGVLHTGNDII